MQQKGPDDNYPMRVTIPLRLYLSLMRAIGNRVLDRVGENHPNKKRVVSHREMVCAMRQAHIEALEEAITDWLNKPRGERWQ